MTTDICENKHGGAATSVEAFEKVEPKITLAHTEITDLLKHLTYGITSKEYAGIVGKSLNCISGRFSELAAMRKIIKTGQRRSGCAVWEVSK